MARLGRGGTAAHRIGRFGDAERVVLDEHFLRPLGHLALLVLSDHWARSEKQSAYRTCKHHPHESSLLTRPEMGGEESLCLSGVLGSHSPRRRGDDGVTALR